MKIKEEVSLTGDKIVSAIFYISFIFTVRNVSIS